MKDKFYLKSIMVLLFTIIVMVFSMSQNQKILIKKLEIQQYQNTDTIEEDSLITVNYLLPPDLSHPYIYTTNIYDLFYGFMFKVRDTAYIFNDSITIIYSTNNNNIILRKTSPSDTGLMKIYSNDILIKR